MQRQVGSNIIFILKFIFRPNEKGVRWALILSTLSIISCHKESQIQSGKMLPELLRDSQNIVSTRPQNIDNFIIILKLGGPALLDSMKIDEGKRKIDPERAKLLENEQSELIKKLKSISSEIQVIYRYKMVLNGIAILGPISALPQVKALGEVAYSEFSTDFQRPLIQSNSIAISGVRTFERNSTRFVGATDLQNEGLRGKNIKIGVIDTGIDYTHKMFGGVGVAEAFKSIDPNIPNDFFPNQQIVGGVDLVGTSYDSASIQFKDHIPKPDMNPLDEGGHGSHVAGTIAGHGDGVNSYDGIAPDSDLYAIKVFGANGSTGDAVVIAALEFAADPDGQPETSDKLDIVNLSLGSSYGAPHLLYSEAIKNLVKGGTAVVASAGNSGPQDYIVGAPSTTNEAISVAASVDDCDHNWKFRASKVQTQNSTFLVEAVEAATSKKIVDAGSVNGKVVYAGNAAEDFSESLKAEIKGNIALIDRGVVAFNDKLVRARDAGAIGVVVANNREGAPMVMGTTDNFNFPAIMISKENGQKIKNELKVAPVQLEFYTEEKIEKPQLIDTLTGFSSKGPRSFDGFLKPEISAPGNNVISAKMGGGAETVQMSGTSMAAPHLTGVLALIMEAHKGQNLPISMFKSLLMGTATTMYPALEEGGKSEIPYLISMQGSGRVQAVNAARSSILIEESGISLGEVSLESRKRVRKVLHLRNLTNENLNFELIFSGSKAISGQFKENNISLNASTTLEIPVIMTLEAKQLEKGRSEEINGFVFIKQNGKELYRVPVLAVVHRQSGIKGENMVVHATSQRESSGALAELMLMNQCPNAGDVLIFNTLGNDKRKPHGSHYLSRDCDLQTAGYRIVSRKDKLGEPRKILQFGIKTYQIMSTWNSCDISVMIDQNGDGIADQELVGTDGSTIPGLGLTGFSSVLLDANKVRKIRKNFEEEIEKAKDDPAKVKKLVSEESYADGFIDSQPMEIFSDSTIAILELDITKLKLREDGLLAIEVLTSLNQQSTTEADDYLGDKLSEPIVISMREEDQIVSDLPEKVSLDGLERKTLELTHGNNQGALLLLFPYNGFVMSDINVDQQSQFINPTYH